MQHACSQLLTTPADDSTPVKFLKPLIPAWQAQLEQLTEASSRCDRTPMPAGLYLVFYHGEKQDGSIHPWRSVNLIEMNCTCHNWTDLSFPCVHSIHAALHQKKPIHDLFNWQERTIESYKQAYYYPFVPIPITATLDTDTSLKVPETQLDDDSALGKRGFRPGPKPKHNRKNAKTGPLHVSVAII